MDLTLIERGNLQKSVNRLLTCGMSLTMNLVQNYSDHFGNSQRSSLSPTGGVKSTSPSTEIATKNGYESCIYSMNNIHMSNEDKHDNDTNYINKHKYTNHDTRQLRHIGHVVFVVLLLMLSHAPHGSRCSSVFIPSTCHP